MPLNSCLVNEEGGEDMAGNREYKSDVFGMLMEDKKNALQLYNALNHSSYQDPDLLEFCTLERGISLTVRNDASFVLVANLSVYELPESVCPRKPVRSKIFLACSVDEILETGNWSGKSELERRMPQFLIFHNGSEDQSEHYDLKILPLSRRFVKIFGSEPVCKVYNISRGRNRELLQKCPVLQEYMTFVDYVREYHAMNDYDDLETAIYRAIFRCMEENVLREFLREHRSEIAEIIEMEYAFDKRIELERNDAWHQGLEEGRREKMTVS